MGIEITHKMTADDSRKLEAAAMRFCTRHNLRISDGMAALETVECAVMDDGSLDTAYLKKLWTRIHIRITGGPSHGWGYIGTRR
jgi:hypothetical protein